VIIETLKQWRVHPFADHFTIALLMVAVLIDLIGSLISSRQSIRYMALTLMILGALAAGASWVTGGWEADRVQDLVTGPAKSILESHSELGDWLVWIFALLALWRIAVQFFGFAARSRSIYLLAAILALLLLGYQGYMGSEMVYSYGVGTSLLTAAQTPSSTPLPPAPTPTSAPTPFTPVKPSPSVSILPTPSPSPSSPSPSATVTPAPMGAASPASHSFSL
jgi:uncharacterized membrane protein